MNNLMLATAVLLAAGQGALAQPSASAGGQLQQIPPPPSQPKAIPDLRIERGGAPAAPGAPGARVLVKTLHVSGATRFSEAALLAATGFSAGRELDLAGLRALAGRITDFYSRHGYFLAQAYLPAQDIDDGAVAIVVVEGRYGKVDLDDHAHVSPALARSILAGLNPAEVVNSAPLERRLLLLSDLPGVAVKSVLSPGAAVGASDLRVDLAPGRRVTGELEVDNGGNPYTGEYRGGGTINFNEPTGHGDMASVRALTSGSGLTYVRASYEMRLQDATVGAAYAHLAYHLGRNYAALNAHGVIDTVSLYGSYPLIRSPTANLYVLADLDARAFRDEVGATSTVTDKTIHAATVGLAGDSRDGLWGGGQNAYAVYWSVGDVNIRTPMARAADAATARANGGYGKLTAQVSRLQALGGPFSLYGEARGQLASKNLDSSEKMELGGAYGVRAYPEGEAYGDDGYLLTLDARSRLPQPPIGGSLEADVFVDNGAVTLDHSPWASGPNHRTLSAAGVGLTWADRRGLTARVSYAFELGNQRATSAPDRSGRIWLQISKFF